MGVTSYPRTHKKVGNQNCRGNSPIWEPIVWVTVQTAWGYPTTLEVSASTDLCCWSILLLPFVHLVGLHGPATHPYPRSFTGAGPTLLLCNWTQLCTSILAWQPDLKTSAITFPASSALSFPLFFNKGCIYIFISFAPQYFWDKTVVVMHTFNRSTQQAEAGG